MKKGMNYNDNTIGQVAKELNKIHGANVDLQVLSHQGASLFSNEPSRLFPAQNPIGMGQKKAHGKEKKANLKYRKY